jgi:hypothetical protein
VNFLIIIWGDFVRGLSLARAEKLLLGSGGMVVLALLASAVSITLQGFEFPTNNNFFHLPIVLEYARSADGPHDAFHASLDKFTSIIWPMLRPFATDWNAGWVFLAAHWLSRAGIVLSFYALLRSLVRTQMAAAVGALLILPFIGAFFSATMVGQSEQLSRGFTHSEIAVALVLGAMALFLQRRFVLAGLLLGLCVNVNIFYAVWGVAALGVARLTELRNPPAGWWRETLWGIIALLAAAAPMSTRIVMEQLIAAPSVKPFDYLAFLADYWPYHFLIQYVAMDHLAFVVVILTQAVIVFRYVLARRDLTAVALAVGGLFALGIVLPFLTGSRLILNLHLLRSDTLIVFLFAAAAISVTLDSSATKLRDNAATTWSWLAVFALVVGSWPAAVLGLGAWLMSHDSVPSSTKKVVAVTLALAAAMLFVPALTQPLAAPGPILSIVAPKGDPTVLPMPHVSWDITRLILLIGGVGFLAWAILAPSPVVVACALATGASIANLPAGIGVAIVTVLVLVCRDEKMSPWGQRLLVAVLTGFAFACAMWTSSLLGKALLGLAAVTGVAVLGAGYLNTGTLGSSMARVRVVGVSTCVALAILIPTAAQAVMLMADRQRDARGEVVAAWLDVQWWARFNTRPGATFLVPLDMPGFSINSRRPVWVDWKQGAAVMWDPGFYWTWKPRLEAQRVLSDLESKVAYARQNNIPFVVVRRSEAVPGVAPLAFGNAQFAVFYTGPT